MEAELKPGVFEIFDSISDKYKRLRKLQDKRNDLKKQKRFNNSSTYIVHRLFLRIKRFNETVISKS